MSAPHNSDYVIITLLVCKLSRRDVLFKEAIV